MINQILIGRVTVQCVFVVNLIIPDIFSSARVHFCKVIHEFLVGCFPNFCGMGLIETKFANEVLANFAATLTHVVVVPLNQIANVGQSDVNLSPLVLSCSRILLMHGGVYCLP